ncbi:hypothetical protein FA13DRAFT_1802486 [Coprinellus micaceus]|uniref:Uncharacterized protein n=1 Tax=Coprinellus micaceus TaxID=71717 RepID=A0A4Y7SD73_COPMI|nr:hypothetical protein FA13DRAFT_1802486 [Coprinellus micaceus]
MHARRSSHQMPTSMGLQEDYYCAKDAYERAVADNPLPSVPPRWLFLPESRSRHPIPAKSLEAELVPARSYMAGSKYNEAYEAYQQAINQDRDGLDTYSRAIRINPSISEVWFDLGSLYESCNNQINDTIDAYTRTAELDPGNLAITQRLQLLKEAQSAGAYASAVAPPPGLNGPLMVHGGHRSAMRVDSRSPTNDISLPPAQLGNGRASSLPFRGGPPPPVNMDESRHLSSSHPPLAPMEVDRPLAHPGHYLPLEMDLVADLPTVSIVDGLLGPIQLPLLLIVHDLDRPVNTVSSTFHPINKLVLTNRRTILLHARHRWLTIPTALPIRRLVCDTGVSGTRNPPQLLIRLACSTPAALLHRHLALVLTATIQRVSGTVIATLTTPRRSRSVGVALPKTLVVEQRGSIGIVEAGLSSPDEHLEFKRGPYSSVKGSPEPVSAAHSVQPSPVSAFRPPVRSIDEVWDSPSSTI